ncbi:MAG: hypothetical protein J3K34DRAFT_277210 [Monoraphidium minutum]|nr:MAG: hypothetical protein J3K34DRAFT_277210 [Monoraphidium minutum]
MPLTSLEPSPQPHPSPLNPPRGLQPGDVAIIDMRICPAGSDAPYPGLDKTRLALDTEADPLGLAAQMVGMVPGEERTWEFSFPGDWHVELWRGQRAAAAVKLRELFKWALPEFDDAFVKAHYPAFDGADDMRKSLLATTAMERFKTTQSEVHDAIMEAVAACVEVELPEAYVAAVAEKEYQEKLLGMIQNKLASPQQVEAMMTEEMLGEFIAEKRAELEERCRWLLATDEILEREGLEVEAGGVDEEVARAKAQFREQELGEFNDEAYRMETLEKLRYLAVMEFLTGAVKVNTLPWAGGAAEPPKQAAAAAS